MVKTWKRAQGVHIKELDLNQAQLMLKMLNLFFIRSINICS